MADGFFLGGVASGAEAAEKLGLKRDELAQEKELKRRGLDIQSRGLDIQERAGNRDAELRSRAQGLQERIFADNQRRQFLANAQTQLSDTLTLITNSVTTAVAAGADPQMAVRGIAGLVESAKRIAPAAGRTPSDIEAAVAAITSQPSLQQSATGKAQATAAGITATAQALNVSPLDVGRAQKVIPALTEPKPRAFFNATTGKQESVDISAPGAAARVNDLVTKGFAPIDLSVRGGSIGELSPGSQETADYFKAQSSSLNVLSETANLRKQLKDSNTISAAFAGGLITGIDTVAQNMVQLAAAVGQQDNRLLDPQAYNLGSFGAQAASTRSFRSNIINLGYVLARAADPRGQLSNKDVQAQIERIGADSGSPRQMAAALAEIDRAVKTSFNNLDLGLRQRIKNLPPIPSQLRIGGDDGADSAQSRSTNQPASRSSAASGVSAAPEAPPDFELVGESRKTGNFIYRSRTDPKLRIEIPPAGR